ncbi:hypothetical protein ScPMuIL_014278 [Solemya velum]
MQGSTTTRHTRRGMDDISLQSFLLTDKLEGVGLSRGEIDWRRQLAKYIDNIDYVSDIITQSGMVSYSTGSRPEGIGLDLLQSDFDQMLCTEGYQIIHKSSDWVYNPRLLLVLTDTSKVHPGFCLLRLMNKDEPTCIRACDAVQFICTTNHQELQVLNHKFLLFGDIYHPHGPAHTLNAGVDVDTVPCLNAHWPPGARDWIHRPRPSNFPPKNLVGNAEVEGAHVVPVGYKFSESREIEWRFSFSLLELKIIQIWPTTTIHCYFCLKLLQKSLTKCLPELPNILSSYHIKTVLFWLVEETGIGFWNDNCLVECLMFSVSRLFDSIANCCIPHYFMGHNLLEKDEKIQRNLMRLLSSFVADRARLCQEITSMLDDYVARSYSRTFCIQLGSNISFQNVFDTEHVLTHERLAVHCRFTHRVFILPSKLVQHVYSQDSLTFLKNMYRVTKKLQTFSSLYDHEMTLTINYIKQIFISMCATHLLSTLKKARMGNMDTAFFSGLLRGMLKENALSRQGNLRLANFYYQIGQYQKAIQVLETVSAMTDRRSLKICGFQSTDVSLNRASEVVVINSPFDVSTLFFTTEHVFMKGEISSTPYALQYDMFKTSHSPAHFYESLQNDYKNHAFVDPDVLHYYLQYLSFSEMGNRKHAQVALDNLKWITTEEDTLQKQTALNVLGQCYLTEGDLRRATNCFVKSLCMKPRYNSALFHLVVTIKKGFASRMKSAETTSLLRIL